MVADWTMPAYFRWASFGHSGLFYNLTYGPSLIRVLTCTDNTVSPTLNLMAFWVCDTSSYARSLQRRLYCFFQLGKSVSFSITSTSLTDRRRTYPLHRSYRERHDFGRGRSKVRCRSRVDKDPLYPGRWSSGGGLLQDTFAKDPQPSS